jgi:hypothetical protein
LARCCSEVEDTSELGCGNKHREHGRTGRPKVVVVEEEEEEEYQLCLDRPGVWTVFTI